jgi:DNA processing protein
LAAELAERGIVVVSGLARGVDSAAHEGSLHAGGPTIAVLGSGLDRIYPGEHVGLSRTISANGLLLSELGPGAPPLAEHFPLRNRIISGISLGTVVVEASEKSGSLITAACAMKQGRDVMAVPGNILSGRNRGSHGLLKDGAKIIETADDILEELGWSLPSSDPIKPRPECRLVRPTDWTNWSISPGWPPRNCSRGSWSCNSLDKSTRLPADDSCVSPGWEPRERRVLVT